MRSNHSGERGAAGLSITVPPPIPPPPGVEGGKLNNVAPAIPAAAIPSRLLVMPALF